MTDGQKWRAVAFCADKMARADLLGLIALLAGGEQQAADDDMPPLPDPETPLSEQALDSARRLAGLPKRDTRGSFAERFPASRRLEGGRL